MNLSKLLIGAVIGANTMLPSPANAQHDHLKNYDWDPAPTLPDTTGFGSSNEVILLLNNIQQFEDQGELIYFYDVFHYQKYLGDDAAVDQNKTLDINTGSIFDMYTLKARSIAPDGTVTELPKSAFLERADDNEKGKGTYFAFEGLRPGSVVEYLMFSKQTCEYRGAVTRLQFSLPIKKETYEMLVPDSWRYQFKGYNGLPEPTADSTLAGHLLHKLELTDVAALESESNADTEKYRMYLVHKLDAIPSLNALHISDYNGATKIYHDALYPDLGAKTKKELAGLVKKIGIGFARDEADRLRTIDRYIHGNFQYAESGAAELSDLDAIMKTRTCNEFGMQRLYANVFREAGIEHQVVLTNDRTLTPFDPEFESRNYLQNVVFYFPGPDKYLDPTEFGLGLGYLAPEYMGNHGLFIKNKELGGAFVGIGKVSFIPDLPAEDTRHDLLITINPSVDATEADVVVKNELTGYYARYIQEFYSLMNEEQQKDILQGHMGHLTEGAIKQDLQVENAKADQFGMKPFTINAKVTTNKFTNQAGNEVLLRVGELIGPQMELYAEKERKLPSDSPFNRYYDRKIIVELPDGWTCADLSPMEVHKVMEIDGKLEAEFRSSATQNDGIITIEIVEYYRTKHVPVEYYEAYRGVINGAADFNKRNLLLKPAG
ncbi:MAG: DUF3857 domain-containing protein [Flavobacteriales bacterium]|nr:DUF3857 domain-containing protein [Flavobacteriales bacterium]